MKWINENNRDYKDNNSFWTEIHNNHYSIWSMTEDNCLKRKILDEIRYINHSNILIVGCGSVVELQNHLCNSLDSINKIICVDYESIIRLAEAKENNSKIKYVSGDLTKIKYYNEFDVVINVNSIVSGSDYENRKILEMTNHAIKTNGLFISFFPTYFCNFEVDSLEKKYNRIKKKFLSDKTSSTILDFWEIYRKNQIFYTPLMLRNILKESGYQILKFELFFCDSDYFRKQAKKMYSILDEDILIYEFYITSVKYKH